jgi:hypothetical protein
VEANADEVRGRLRRRHGESLAEERGEARISIVGETLRISPRSLHSGPQTARASGRDDRIGKNITQSARRAQSALRKNREEKVRARPLRLRSGQAGVAAPEEKRGAQRDTLLIVSGCAPRRQVHCGEKLSGRNQRRGSATRPD